MALLLYSARMDADEERLLDVIQPNAVEISRSLQALRADLNKPMDRVRVAILMVSDRKELQQVAAMEGLFLDWKIILILSDEDRESLGMAHQLRPRFISLKGTPFKDVAAVLTRMIKLYGG